MEDQKRPTRLFRYFPLEASDIFSTQKLWASAAKDFNDVFEVVPRYDSLISSSIERELKKQFAFLPPEILVDWKTYKKRMQIYTSPIYSEAIEVVPQGFQEKFSEHFGIICFSENLESLLMWGHYASSHQGFVIEFDVSHSLFGPKELAGITYSKERPLAEAAEQLQHQQILLTKSSEWSYESEHRLIKPLKNLNQAMRRDKKEKHCVDLPFDAVKAIYFGCKVSKAAYDEILNDLKDLRWRHVSKFVMRRHETKYAIQPLPLEQIRELPLDARKDFDELWKAMKF